MRRYLQAATRLLTVAAWATRLRSWWSQLIGWLRRPTWRDPDKAPDTVDTRTAVHEAGHTIAAWRCTAVTRIHEVTLDGPHGGYCRYEFLDCRTAAELWCLTVIQLAGIAAELTVFDKTRSGPAEKDLRQARRRAQLLAQHDEPPWSLPPEPGPTARFDHLFHPPLSTDEARVLHVAYRKARQLIRDSRHAHARLVALLLHQRTVRTPALTQLLGTRAFTRFLRTLQNKPRFVERRG